LEHLHGSIAHRDAVTKRQLDQAAFALVCKTRADELDHDWVSDFLSEALGVAGIRCRAFTWHSRTEISQ
jgi:hypothetical protein